MKLSLISGLAALAIAGAALAQEQPPPPPGGGEGQGPSPEMLAARQAMRAACASDMQTLCSGKMGREMMMCMRENHDKLSDGCKDAISKMPRRNPPPPPSGQ